MGIDILANYPELPDEFSVLKCLNCGLINYSPRTVGQSDIYEALSSFQPYYGTVRWDHVKALSFLYERSPKSLLDVGCGNGSLLVGAKCILGNVIGIDPNPTAVRACMESGVQVHQDIADVDGTSFDAISALQVIEHVEDPGRLLRDLVERLAPGGYLLLSAPNDDGLLSEVFTDALNAPPHHVTRWPKQSLEWVGGNLGLRLVEYATEPANLDSIIAYLSDTSMKLFPGERIKDRVQRHIAFFRAKLDLLTRFAFEKPTLPAGHTHFVGYEKS